jgi:acetyl esterase/lipase
MTSRSGRRPRPAGSVGVAMTAIVVLLLARPAGGDEGRAAPLLPTPSLDVAPNVGLTDGQAVAVAGSGFAPEHTSVGLVQCAADPAGEAGCDSFSSAAAEIAEDGSFSADMTVYALIHTAGQGTVDCRVPARCVLVASSDPGNPAATVEAPIAFDPGRPLLPPATLTLSPATGVVDGQAVRAAGNGFRPPAAGGAGDDRSVAQLYQCAPTPSWDTCRAVAEGSVPVEPDGTIGREVPVLAKLRIGAGEVDCRTSVEPCLLVAAEPSLGSRWVATAELGFDPDAPLLPDPEIVATPTAELGDFNTLSVRGSHFAASGNVSVQVCHAQDLERCDEDSAEHPTPDASNGFDLDLTGWAIFTVDSPGGGSVDCRQAPGCVLVATDEHRGLSASVPLGFGAPGPPRGRYLDPVFDEVEVERDVVYREALDYAGNPVQLRLDIYRPAGDAATSRPAVVWMHGGWFAGVSPPDAMASYAREFARRGYVGVTLRYRLRPTAGPAGSRDELYAAMLDAYDDATAAVEWLQDHAGDYGIDADAIAAGGWSAGAVNASNLAYLPGQSGPSTSRIAAALPIGGWFVDPDDPALPPPARAFARPDRGEPPAIVFHGTEDELLPVGSPRDLCPLAARVDIVCEHIGYEGDAHDTVDRRQRDIVRRGADFVTEQVLEPRGYFDVAVDAGGPHAVAEGSTLTLEASGHPGDGLSFAWTPAERLDDPRSPTPTFTGHDDATATLTVTATNSHGITAADHTDVTTLNVEPAVEGVQATVEPAGPSVSLAAAVTDRGVADTHQAEIDWGDGTVDTATVEQGAGKATVRGTHTYAETGDHEVTLTVRDDDGGTVIQLVNMPVGCSIVGSEADDHLGGTGGDDVICGQGGNDVITGRGGHDRIYGGDGDDLLYGGQGGDILVGDDGHDRADGGPGRDRCSAETRRSCRPTA